MVLWSPSPGANDGVRKVCVKGDELVFGVDYKVERPVDIKGPSNRNGRLMAQEEEVRLAI